MKVTVEAPASSANIGPGFDVFAVALGSPSDRVTLRSEKDSRLSVKITNVKGTDIPTDPAKNAAGAVCVGIGKAYELKQRISVEIVKGVPVGRGMGSSGASSAAAALAMNEAFDLQMSGDEMIYYAGMGEQATSGTAHYDNVSASVLGGFVVVRCANRPMAVRFDAPENLSLCIATPLIELPEQKTKYARSVLPKSIPLKTLVSNVANASLIISGFAKSDVSLIGAGMNDLVVERARKTMIPGYDVVRKAALDAGAAGVCISGAGPSMLSVVDSKTTEAVKVLDSMVDGFGSAGIEADGFVTEVGEGAARV